MDLLVGYNRDEFALFAPQKGFTERDVLPLARVLGLGETAVDAYRATYPGISGPDLCTLMYSDSLFRMPTIWVAEAHAAAGGRTCPIGTMLLGEPPPADFHTLSEQMRGSRLSFASTGDPGWPRFTADQGITRIWDVPLSLLDDPQAASRRIWERTGHGS